MTPFAQGRDLAQIRTEIDQYNAINLVESQAAGAHYFDITPISRLAADDPTLLTTDTLHPSEKMYAAWVDLILPYVIQQIQ